MDVPGTAITTTVLIACKLLNVAGEENMAQELKVLLTCTARSLQSVTLRLKRRVKVRKNRFIIACAFYFHRLFMDLKQSVTQEQVDNPHSNPMNSIGACVKKENREKNERNKGRMNERQPV